MKFRKIQLIFLLMIGVFVMDSVQDAASFHEPDRAESGICHTCSCGFHLSNFDSSLGAVRLEQDKKKFVAYEPSFHVSLLPKSIFHPPKTLA